MVVIVVIGVILIATAGANAVAARRNRNDALLRHERALAALRESSPPIPIRSAACRPRTTADRSRPHPERTPGGCRRSAGAHNRPPPPAGPPCAAARDIEARPTAAQLPRGRQPPRTVRRRPTQAVATLPGEPNQARAARTRSRSRQPRSCSSRREPRRSSRRSSRPLGRSPRRRPAAGRHADASDQAHAPHARARPEARPRCGYAASAGGNGTITVTVPFTLTMAQNGPCWVSVQTETGRTLYEEHARLRPTPAGRGTSPSWCAWATRRDAAEVNGAQVNLAGVAPRPTSASWHRPNPPARCDEKPVRDARSRHTVSSSSS
jgi:hypothetical protein